MAPNNNLPWSSCEFRFAPDHPTGAGHFPSNPIIPGALLLAQVLSAIDLNCTLAVRREIRHVKFLKPVRPGDQCIIRWRRLPGGEQQFEIRLLGLDDPVLVGSMRAITA